MTLKVVEYQNQRKFLKKRFLFFFCFCLNNSDELSFFSCGHQVGVNVCSNPGQLYIVCNVLWSVIASDAGNAGDQSNGEGYSGGLPTGRRPEVGRAGGVGEGEGPNRRKSRGSGQEGVMGRTGLVRGPNGWFYEAHVLGALLGRHGAYLLLCHLPLLHGWLRLLPSDRPGALLRGLLRGPTRCPAPPPHEAA